MIDSSSQIQKTRQLRHDGLSLREIGKKTGVPLSTTHLWTKDIVLTNLQKQRLIEKHQLAFNAGRKIAQKIKHQYYMEKRNQQIEKGRNIVGKLSERDLFVIGVGLYWGEGFKKDSRFGFANSDPRMIVFILSWLYKTMDIKQDDIRLRLGINIALQEKVDDIQKSWSKITSIPLSQFQKAFYQKTVQTKQYSNTEEYLGVLRIRVNNHPELLPTIMGMIDEIHFEKK